MAISSFWNCQSTTDFLSSLRASMNTSTLLPLSWIRISKLLQEGALSNWATKKLIGTQVSVFISPQSWRILTTVRRFSDRLWLITVLRSLVWQTSFSMLLNMRDRIWRRERTWNLVQTGLYSKLARTPCESLRMQPEIFSRTILSLV
eukprot:20242_5